ncbi:MAG: hypothetical protein ACYC3L_05475 [Gemmatimonadaceae bacterium]
MISTLISLAVIAVGALMGYGTARRFVRDRLRFVDGAHKPSVALIAGVATFLIAMPVASLISILPLVHLGVGAALTVGLSVGMGVTAGSRDVREGRYELKP